MQVVLKAAIQPAVVSMLAAVEGGLISELWPGRTRVLSVCHKFADRLATFYNLQRYYDINGEEGSQVEDVAARAAQLLAGAA
mmetsp:Transcript_31202/g.69384  ORF Transcript_31202/g.69384 Transcript_31202/m.69384 type:complete len:82 (-) Transcript_31202:797-1042(-)